MSDASASPEVHDDDRLDIDGDVEPEDVIDDEADGIVDVDDDEEKNEEDLEMNEDEGDNEEAYEEQDNHGFQNGDHATGDLEESVDAAILEDEGPNKKEEKKSVKPPPEEDDEFRNLISRPPHGSEVFIGGVSRDTTEDDLRELCSPLGDIFEVRLLKDKETGNNKGYAFVTFMNKETAEKAIETLANSELKGRKLRFSHSQAKNKLFIGNIPKSWDVAELERVLGEEGPGIQNIELKKDPRNPGKNRGFAFVEYYNHACADYARKVMSRASFRLGNNIPSITWPDSRSGNENSTTSQIKVVYVRNMPDNVTEEQVRNLFEHHGEITKVVLPPGKPGQPRFGFIHFTDRNDALKAIDKSEKYELEGRVVEASLAKPPVDKKNHMDHSFGPHRLIPQLGRNAYSFPVDIYNSMGPAYGHNRYNQPLIYGRGPPPAGMTMVPIQLPDGRLGYVLQQPGLHQGGHFGRGVVSSSYRNSSSNSGSGGGSSSRRYRPY